MGWEMKNGRKSVMIWRGCSIVINIRMLMGENSKNNWKNPRFNLAPMQ
jgi:hypothetical protein